MSEMEAYSRANYRQVHRAFGNAACTRHPLAGTMPKLRPRRLSESKPATSVITSLRDDEETERCHKEKPGTGRTLPRRLRVNRGNGPSGPRLFGTGTPRPTFHRLYRFFVLMQNVCRRPSDRL